MEGVADRHAAGGAATQKESDEVTPSWARRGPSRAPRSATARRRVPDRMDAPSIALVLDGSLDRPDGVQQHVLTLGRWLTGQGQDVHYVAPSTTRDDLPQLHRIGRSMAVRANGNALSTPTFTRGRELHAVLDDLALDVVHVAMPCSPLLAGRLVTRVPSRTAVVGTFHIVPAGPAIAVGAWLMALAQRRQLRRFDRMLAVSAPARTSARSAFVDATVAEPGGRRRVPHRRSGRRRRRARRPGARAVPRPPRRAQGRPAPAARSPSCAASA